MFVNRFPIVRQIGKMALAAKYYPTDSPQGREDAINREWKPLGVIEFEIEHMTGKEAIELVRARQV